MTIASKAKQSVKVFRAFVLATFHPKLFLITYTSKLSFSIFKLLFKEK
ncbi:hypothetical protein KCTC32420_00916 [Aequorivita nionensis]